ncbi:MAG TPA: patatin-like phospholipase family protein [Roseiflexaceae bacterium]|nr:patatin-like phospholipase family protein [Roseiflexaceae bacterium]
MSVAIVMSGGGAKGAFEVGVLKYLIEVKGVRADIVCGASVGALNALKLAEGPKGSTVPFQGLEQIWRGIRGDQDIFRFNPKLDTGLAGLGKELVSGDIAAAVRKVRLLGLAALIDPFHRFEDLFSGTSADIIGDAIKATLRKHLGGVESIFNLDPLRQLISNNLNASQVEQSGIELRMAMVDLISGLLLYADQRGQVHYDQKWEQTRKALEETAQALRAKAKPELDARISGIFGTPQVTQLGIAQRLEGLVQQITSPPALSLVDAVVASSAIPVIFDPVRVSQQLLVDGGVREVIPLEVALDLGGTEVYAIAASSGELPTGLPASGLVSGLSLASTLERIISIMAAETTENDLRAARPNVIVEVIRPPLDIQDTLDFGRHIIALNIFYGFEVARIHFEGGQPLSNDVVLQLALLARLLDELDRVKALLRELQDASDRGTFRAKANALQLKALDLQKVLDQAGVPRVPGLNAPVMPSIPLSIFVSSNSLVMLTGGTAAVEVGITGQLALGGRVNLQLLSPNPGITGRFSINPAVSNSTLTLNMAASVPPGNYELTVQGTSGNLTTFATLTLTVKRFSLSLAESIVSLPPGRATQTLTVTIARAVDFTASVDLSLDGIPSGVGFGQRFSPDPATGSTSTLSLRSGRFAAPGEFQLTIRGASDGLVETVPLIVEVLGSGSP